MELLVSMIQGVYSGSVQLVRPVRFSGQKGLLLPAEEEPRKVAVKQEKKSFSARQLFCRASVVSCLAVGAAGVIFPPALWGYAVLLPLIGLGVHDMVQKEHAILRNFPLVGHLRYMAESIRPMVQQYWVADDKAERPIPRYKRDILYERGKGQDDRQPFGTQKDVNEINYQWIGHSIIALEPPKEETRLKLGGVQCKQPYMASRLNISSMSWGALSKNGILALNKGAHMGKILHWTGEGSISPYHFGVDVNVNSPAFDYGKFIDEMSNPEDPRVKEAGDLVWQIGTGYFGCRNPDGTFNAQEFARKARLPSVKAIEIKLSQGAKPGHGGVLPKEKLTAGIAKLRGVPMGQDVISPPSHSAFSTPRELLEFLQQLRELSGGKPVGFKLAIGNKHEFLAICKAMLEEPRIFPDFINIDGGEGGTGAAPRGFSDAVGMPLNHALVFVQNALVGFGIRDKMRVIGAGLVLDEWDMISKIALGADMLNMARGLMEGGLGCIQALQCHTNRCPSGTATQDEELMKGLDPKDKSVRVYNLHKRTIKPFLEIIAAAGLKSPSDIKPWLIQANVSPTEYKPLSELYEFIEPGSLLSEDTVPESFKQDWQDADPGSFARRTRR